MFGYLRAFAIALAVTVSACATGTSAGEPESKLEAGQVVPTSQFCLNEHAMKAVAEAFLLGDTAGVITGQRMSAQGQCNDGEFSILGMLVRPVASYTYHDGNYVLWELAVGNKKAYSLIYAYDGSNEMHENSWTGFLEEQDRLKQMYRRATLGKGKDA